MTKLIIVINLLVLSSLMDAQVKTESGKWAVLIGVNNDLEIEQYTGTSIGAQYLYSDGLCLRFGLSLDFETFSSPKFRYRLSSRAQLKNKQSIDFGISFHTVKYTKLSPIFSFVVGMGAKVGFREYDGSGKKFDFSYSKNEYYNLIESSRSYQLLGLLGVDIEITNFLHCNIEYNYILDYYTRKESHSLMVMDGIVTKYESETENISKWSFDKRNIILGLVFYF